ncbi:family 78 glycoside hydrolase catalytic domain [Streptomyces sp. SP2-10]|uniref:family 78 glycoside hydrolase catalytic domain n=1 Tax=Streptomyces sp. SP2-10 TaxID=2873385 RepID=UPI001CA6DBC9|nr:family 78 glycoside hydrolase catalytic domain [Streptomyces sp. SP2-10]MBY8844467.1 glycoside hydrolase family 78 protein [Streptomyces sp. SP2-10]
MAPQTTPPAPGSPTPRSRSAISRRHFLGTGSALTAGALAAGVGGALSGRAQAAAGGSFRADPVDLSPARWIWYPEGDPATDAPVGHRYFRRTFTVAAGEVTDAQLVVTGDDTVDVWLNGEFLAGSPRVPHSWRTALYVDLRTAVRPGTNTIALASRNQGGPAGLIARVRVLTSGGTTDAVTDARWSAGKEAPEGWEQPGFADGGWPAARDLGAYGTAPWYTAVTGPDLAAASPLSVAACTVEHRTSPLGIDAARPRFGWKLDSSAPQQRQGGYRIQVSSTADGTGDLWDSGTVPSGRQIDIPYAGASLASLTRCFWRVRVWDTQGRAGAWSAPRWFETGLLSGTDEWRAAFIGRPPGPDLSGAGWIWYPEGDPAGGRPAETRCFRRTFTLTGAPAAATLVVTGDDTADVWVNGTLVSASPRVTDSWKRAASVDVTAHLSVGANTIAIASRNTSQSPAGLIAKLTVTGGPTVVTDAAWKAYRDAPSGWQTPGYDDAAWPAARVVASYGGGPWGSGVQVVGPAPLLRKSFTVRGPVASARLLTTALGLHETRLNGAKVGDRVLAPGWTDYGKRLQYQVFDVTTRIRQGANALGAWLGNGWYSGSLGIAGGRRYGTQPWYSAQLVITFTDGTTQLVTTDGSWRTSTGAITADDLYHGETYDARLHIAGWDGAGFDDGDWTAVAVRDGAPPRMVAQPDDGVCVQQEFRPVRITEPKPGVWILDLGQNLTGWNRIALRGAEGTTVTVRHGEVLEPDGTLYTTNLRAAQATDRFTLAGTGDVETYEPRFTVHGYRYVELTGLPAGFTPDEDTVTGRAVWTDAAQPGTFRTSDPLINQLQHNIVWGERGNMLSVPTDCPQRDERLGWTGDIAAFCATSTFNLDTHAFLAKFTDDLTDAQQADGAFTDVAPAVAGGSGTAGWGDAGTIIPYTLWQRFGDLAVVDRHFTAMAKWVDYLRNTAGSDLIRNRQTYGDWLNVNDDTAQDLICTAYFAWSARLVARMAAATDRTAEAASYGRLADQVAAAFTARFVAGDGTVRGNTQTGYVLALAFGLLPASLVQPAADKLAARVAAAGGHLSVGFLGVENLLPVLADHGHADTAYRILLQRGFPGWGYMIDHGATTIWERWDGIRTDGSFNDPGMNSFNHYGLGSVGDFLYRHVGGLAPARPGYAALRVAPRPGGGLTSADSTYDTPYGEAASAWSISGSRLTLRVTVPVNTFATVTVPTSRPQSTVAPAQAVPAGPASYHLPAGTHTFTAEV